MTDPDWRAEEAANAVYDEQESNVRAGGDGGPRDEDSAGTFAEEAADEIAESARGASVAAHADIARDRTDPASGQGGQSGPGGKG